MRGIVWLTVLFAAAVVAALTLGRNDGLVSLFWGGWRVDLSLTGADPPGWCSRPDRR